MKEIKAYIKKHKLDEVIRALRVVDGLTGVSIIGSCGLGRGWSDSRGCDGLLGRPRIKIEIVCNDSLADEIVEIIEQAAHTGLKGDGKIYVSEIQQAVRISTGERGEIAV